MPRRPESLDPVLPYLQIARGVEGQAASLAPLLGVTFQHAVGAMLIFWRGFSDRRFLVNHMDAGAIVLADADVRSRLRLAFGLAEVDPQLLVATGFLEPASSEFPANFWRVRGGSRMLLVERSRLERMRSRGRPATPVSPLPKEHKGVDSVPSGDPPPRSHPGEVRGERREERGKEDLFGPVGSAPRKPSKWETIWSELVDLRAQRLQDLGDPQGPQEFKPQRLNHLLAGVGASVALRMREDPDWPEGVDDLAAIRALWEIYLRNTFWRLKAPPFPLEGFAAAKTQEALWTRLGSTNASGEDWS